MPSTKPHISVRIDQALYDKLLARSILQGRSLSNLVEQIVRREFTQKKSKVRR